MTTRCLTTPLNPSRRYRLNRQEYKGLRTMLNEVDNSYRQNAIGSADSVMLNAYAINNSIAAKLRCYAADSVVTRQMPSSNVCDQFKVAVLAVGKCRYCSASMKEMADIVTILFGTLQTFAVGGTRRERLHQFFETLNVVAVRWKSVSAALLIILWSSVQVTHALPFHAYEACTSDDAQAFCISAETLPRRASCP